LTILKYNITVKKAPSTDIDAGLFYLFLSVLIVQYSLVHNNFYGRSEVGVAVNLTTEYGRIDISEEAIKVIAGSAAMECYGLVGMASRKQLKDGIAELLGRENLARGVEVNLDNHRLAIHLYIIVSYGTKISEVAHNIQLKVKYVLNEIVGLEVDQVNIVVQGVRVSS
jgi:uncharacterized alkaline shock family protein YloU